MLLMHFSAAFVGGAESGRSWQQKRFRLAYMQGFHFQDACCVDMWLNDGGSWRQILDRRGATIHTASILEHTKASSPKNSRVDGV